MALTAACTRGSRCTTSRIHQHDEKNSVLLKEVLTRERASMRRASFDDTTTHSSDEAGSACTAGIGKCQDCSKALCRRHFLHSRFSRALRARLSAARRRRGKRRCADSESRILATKKFSCLTPSRLAALRQNRLFARIGRSRFAVRDGRDRRGETTSAMRARCARPDRAALRCRAWTSGGR